MLTQDSKVVWYGKLKADAGGIPVIYDPLLVPSIKGCIYLYHSGRDEIVQYTWQIVQKLLVDVDKVEKASIKKEVDAKWKSARRRFAKGRVQALTPGYKPSPAPARPTEAADNKWDSSDDDGFELDDIG